MKNMKSKTILMACSLSLAAALGGCSVVPSIDAVKEPQQTADIAASHRAEPSESGTDEPEKALLSYQEILKAAPSIEGEHPQLDDASFSREENQALFGNHYELFALYDINQDDIPELMALSTVNFRWTPISVYTYADGETVLLKEPLEMASDCTFEQRSTANGAYITYICEENHIHSVWRGTTPVGEVEENDAYILEGTTLTAVDCTTGESENTIYFYDIAKANTAENVDAMMP